MPLPAVTNRTLAGRGAGSTKSPAAWSSWSDEAGLRPADEVVAHDAVRDGLDGDGDAAVGAVGRGGERSRRATGGRRRRRRRCGRTGRATWPRQPRPGRITSGHGVAGLGVHGDDAAAQLGAGAQRVDQVDVVGGHERRGDQLGELQRAVAQPWTGSGGGGRRHALSILRRRAEFSVADDGLLPTSLCCGYEEQAGLAGSGERAGRWQAHSPRTGSAQAAPSPGSEAGGTADEQESA